MQTFECEIIDDRLEASAVTLIVVETEERACELTRRLLAADAHRVSAKLRLGGKLIFTATRAELVEGARAPQSRSWRMGGFLHPTKH